MGDSLAYDGGKPPTTGSFSQRLLKINTGIASKDASIKAALDAKKRKADILLRQHAQLEKRVVECGEAEEAFLTAEKELASAQKLLALRDEMRQPDHELYDDGAERRFVTAKQIVVHKTAKVKDKKEQWVKSGCFKKPQRGVEKTLRELVQEVLTAFALQARLDNQIATIRSEKAELNVEKNELVREFHDTTVKNPQASPGQTAEEITEQDDVNVKQARAASATEDGHRRQTSSHVRAVTDIMAASNPEAANTIQQAADTATAVTTGMAATPAADDDGGGKGLLGLGMVWDVVIGVAVALLAVGLAVFMYNRQ